MKIDSTQLMRLRDSWSGTLEVADGLVTNRITDQTGLAESETTLAQLRRFKRRVTAFFEPMKKSVNQTRNEILAREKEVRGPIERCEAALVAEISRYRREAAKAQAELQSAVVEAIGGDLPVEILQPETEDVYTGVTYRTQHDFEVVDEGSVSRSFLMIDRKKILELMRLKTPEEVEKAVGGIKIITTQIPVVR